MISIIQEKIMNMTPNDCAKMIIEKDKKIEKLENTVEKLRRKCNRYEKKLSSIYLNGDFK